MVSTTRSEEKVNFLKENGSDYVIVDEGSIAEPIKAILPQGVDKVLELIGTVTLKDSFQCLKPWGILCMTGILGGEWTIKEFSPMDVIPPLRRLTTYGSDPSGITSADLQEYINRIASKEIKLNLDRTFKLDEIAAAHQYMESNPGKGKIVVLVN